MTLISIPSAEQSLCNKIVIKNTYKNTKVNILFTEAIMHNFDHIGSFKYKERFSRHNAIDKQNCIRHIREQFHDKKKQDFCQNVTDSYCFNSVCLRTWFPVPALCGDLEKG